MHRSVFVIIPFLAAVNAANDWSIPCVRGQCSYDLPVTDASSSGTMKIWGSEDAITDITSAADWQILVCDPNALSQNIRLVCMNDPDDPNSLCGHLYQNTGAMNKIVRLPENCGANAFARVSKAWVPDDQSIPSSIKGRIFRRNGKAPVVKALALDTNFDAVDWSKTGKVNIAIHAANFPGAATDIQIPRSRRFTRGFLGGIIHGIEGAATKVIGDVTSEVVGVATAAANEATSVFGDVTSEAVQIATDVASAAGTVATDVVQAAGIAGDLLSGGNKTFDISPLSFSKSTNLFNTSVDCGPLSAALSVDISANATAQPALTISAQGTLAPFSISNFQAVAGMTAHVEGVLTVGAEITGHVDSGKITLLNVGVPGFDFPGVITVGPFFQVDAQFVGDVDISLDMAVGINFDVNNAQLSFPPDSSNTPDSKAFTIGDTPLTLSASPSVQATGTLTAHLIPSLNIGITALGGKGDATIFLALDTSAALVLSLDASAEITQPIANVTLPTSDETANTTVPAATAKRDDATISDSFGGCVQVVGGVDVNAGADGKFFDLFDKFASVSLFTKRFQIFKKCFGDGATATPAVTRRRMRRVSRDQHRRAPFSCPIPGLSPPAPVTDGTVSSSSIAEV
ncbi:hypothetical protein DFH09DRAFT_1355028 [Mycena vulgaris]|nr:hypothetical protein DFH09DRAFT_1355028 [Mycena vulgaris]